MFVSPFKYYTRQLLLHETTNYIILILNLLDIRLSEKFLSSYEEITHAQRFLFYIILLNYIRFILFCRYKHRDISQTSFHVCTKVHCCK